MRTNGRAEDCANCGTFVAANEGTLQGPPWKVFCQTCLPRPTEQTNPAILFDVDAIGIFVKPTAFLKNGFYTYKAACDAVGAAFDGNKRCNRVTEKQVAPLVETLRKDFPLKITDAVRQTVTQAIEEAEEARKEAQKRTAEVDAILAERGHALYGFQKAGVDWLAPLNSALLADDMGLGKTIQTLCAVENAPILVVCPKVAKTVWRDEVNTWRPDLTPTVLEGRNSFRWPTQGEVVITNYDILPDMTGEEIDAIPEGCVFIADEAHVLTGKTTKRSRRCEIIAEHVKAKGGKSWALTATPLMDRPPQLWRLLQVFGLTEEAFGTKGQFNKAFGAVFNGYGWDWGTPEPWAADRLERVMLRRRKVDVLEDLPGKTYKTVTIDTIDKKTIKVLDELEKFLGGAKGLTVEKIKRALANADGFEMISKARAALATAKAQHVVGLIEEYEEAGEPVIVFSAHRNPVLTLGKREGWAIITGDTPTDMRNQIKDDFQAGKLKGIAATIKAAGVALTLTRACNAIFIDKEWTPKLNEQAEDRIYRIGQDRGVVITSLVANHPLDSRLHEILATKNQMVNATIEAAAKGKDFKVEKVEVDLSSDTVDTGAEDAFKAKLAQLATETDAKLAEEAKKKEEERKRKEAEKRDPKLRMRRQGLTVSRRRAAKKGIEVEGTPRKPANEREIWAANALVALAGLDPDKAAEKNGVGFNKGDGSIGHYLASQVQGEGLTNGEWQIAIMTCSKYWRQVGRLPSREKEINV